MKISQNFKFDDNVLDYLSSQSFLIIHKNQVIRQLVRSVLTEAGIKKESIDVAIKMSDALKIYKEHRHKFIVCATKVIDIHFSEIFNIQLKDYPNRIQSSFFVIENDNSPSAVVNAMTYDVDGVISEPLSQSGIKLSFNELLLEKSKPSADYVQFEEGKIALRCEKYDEALKLFELAAKSNAANANYYIAEIKHKAGDVDNLEIEKFLNKSLEKNKKHYKSLDLLSKIQIESKKYDEAYDTFKSLTSYYPINPESLPNLIRVAIYKEEYEEIMSLSRFFSTLERQNPEITTSMAAGLVICAKHLFETRENNAALDMLRRAAKMAKGRVGILKSIALVMLNAGQDNQVEAIIEAAKTDDMREEDFEAIMILIYTSIYDSEKTLLYAVNVIRKGIYHVDIFETCLKLAKKLSKDALIDEIYNLAKTKFPEREEKFKKYK